MQKTIAAMAVLNVCIASAAAQSNVTLYGIVDAGLTHVRNDSPVGGRASVEAGQMQVSRWGVRGVEDLGGGMKARFGLESTLLNDTGVAGVATGTPSSTSLFDREATVGLSGSLGSIDLGRQNILGVQSVGLADPMGLAFAATNPNVLFSAMNHAGVYGPYGANNGGTALRQNNSVRYVSPLYQGAGFALMHGFGEQAGDSGKSTYQGGSAFYNNGPFGIAGAYARLTNAADTDHLSSHAIGVKYAMSRAVFKGTWSANKLDSTGRKISVYGIGVDVPVSPLLTLTGAFYNTRRTGDLRDDSQQYIFISRYALSKRSTAYASIGRANTDTVVTAAQINLAQGFVAVGSDSANRVTVGLMHYF
ncbi:porin [Pseudoduganella buxea]|uniref:Porin n=1 Tax=Pseudoduganella buxea TaxID=1949069 RepID=A0A6I3STG6_9BURK|nr:porin [Pseudoduganella buxea]MTV52334.1 porin [Pseudoduganella buxea]GGC06739.1 porin [Pseudoduganella buxea]